MTLDEAQKILEAGSYTPIPQEIDFHGGVCDAGCDLGWRGDSEANLHGTFTADQLEAIAVWMRAHARKAE